MMGFAPGNSNMVMAKYKSEVKRTKSAPHGSRRVSVTDEVVADPSQVGG